MVKYSSVTSYGLPYLGNIMSRLIYSQGLYRYSPLNDALPNHD